MSSRIRNASSPTAPVTIAEPHGTINSVGLELDNKAKTVKFNSHVSGQLQPQTAHPMIHALLRFAVPRRLRLAGGCVALPVAAEKADRDKPINYQADSRAT